MAPGRGTQNAQTASPFFGSGIPTAAASVTAREPDRDLELDQQRHPYADPGGDFYSRLHPDKARNRAIDQLRSMGYAVTLSPLQNGAAL